MIWQPLRGCRYPLSSGDTDEISDDIELFAADQREGVAAASVVHNATDDNDHVYELAGVGRDAVPAGVMNVTCVASRTSVKKARTHKVIAMSNDDDEDNDGDDASFTTPARTNLHPPVLGVWMRAKANASS